MWAWFRVWACVLLLSPAVASAGKLDRHLVEAIAGGAQEVDVVVSMQDDPRHALHALAHRPRENRPLMMGRLLRNARETQAKVRGLIDAHARKAVRSHVLANAVSTRLPVSEVLELAKRPDVRKVWLDRKMRMIERPPVPLDFAAALLSGQVGPFVTYTYGLTLIKADQVWSTFGVRGAGVTIGNIDTGVDAAHPDLAGKIVAFKDFVGSQTVSYDDHGHGTHTAGTHSGGETSGEAIGVAPASKIIVAKFLGADGSGTGSAGLAAMDWMTNPDGNAATDDAPPVVSNSWGRDGTDEFYRDAVRNWVTLGIFPCFSAGNDGPDPSTMGSPGAYPEAFAVGATNSSDQIASFSSRGPVSLDGTSYVRPDVSAPGVGVKSARSGGGYVNFNGTSMACPHVAGVIALMLEYNPSLTITQIRTALESTAVDLGTAGKDDTYGAGRVDALAAVTAIAPDVRMLTPLAGARIAPGSSVNVTWRVGAADVDNPVITQFEVHLSTDSGATFPTLIGTAGTSGRAVTWNVPAGLRSTQVRLRVRAKKVDLSVFAEDLTDSDVVVNGRPVVPSFASTIVRPAQAVTLDGSAASDPDGDALTYVWRQSGGAQAVSLTNALQAVAGMTASSVRGDATALDFSASDATESVTVTRTVRVNRLPPVNAGADVNVGPSALATLSGSGTADPDGGATTYQWIQTGGPSVGGLGSSLAPSFPVPASRGVTMTFQLRVDDPLETATDDTIVKVNLQPVAAAGGSQKVAPGALVTLRGTDSRDPDNDALQYTWARIAGPIVTLGTPNAANATFLAPLTRGVSSTFRLEVRDGVDTSTAQTVVSVNQLPVAVTQVPPAVRPSTQVSLSAAGSSDPDGDALTYTWAQVTGPAVSFDPNAVAPTFTAPATRGVSMTFKLTLNDGTEQTVVTNRVVRVNQVPVAAAAAPTVVVPGTTVQLDATRSTDADGDPLAYAWAQTGGVPVGFTPGAARPSFVAPSARGQRLTFGLTVTDGVDSSGATEAAVVLNRLPLVQAVMPSRMIPGAEILMDGTASIDPEGSPLTYKWTQIKGPTVSISATSPRPTFFAPKTRGDELAFALEVSDGLESSAATFTTRVNKPPVARLPREVAGPPDTRIVLTAKASTDPDDDTLAFRWTQTGGPEVPHTREGREIEVDLSGLARGTELAFQCEATDGQETNAAPVKVRVNRAPDAGPPRAMVTLPGTSFSMRAETTDEDGDKLTYTWRQTSGTPVAFEPSARTLAFTTPAVGRQAMAFELSVTDGIETASTRMTVELEDRAYEADLGGGAAGGCQARRTKGTSDGTLAMLFVGALLVAVRRTGDRKQMTGSR